MKTVLITEGQVNAVESAVVDYDRTRRALLNEENSTDRKKVERIIAEFCHEIVRPYLYRPAEDCDIVKNQAGETGTFKKVVNNQNGFNRLIDYFRLNLYEQFGMTRDNGPARFRIGIARIACDDLGYYSFGASIQGGKIIKFGKLMKLFAYKPDLMFTDGHIPDKNLDGMSYDDLMATYGEKLDAYVESQKSDLENDINSNLNSRHDPAADNSERRMGTPSEVYRCGDYKIYHIKDSISNFAPSPDYSDKLFLDRLGQYADWCICGPMGAYEYAQYMGNGGNLYIMLKDGFQNIPKEQGENCPLDEYGLSMIAVIVGTDGLPDNVTTRWNHDFGGENHSSLWEAIQLQKITGVKYSSVFKPRSRQQLQQMYLSEEKSTPSAMDQVHNKVNAGVMDAVTGGGMMEESNGNTETWYRGYNAKFGSERTHLLWFTDDISYARAYGNRVEEVVIDMDKLNAASIYEIDEIVGYEFDYYDGIDEEDVEKAMAAGYGGYEFEVAENEGYYCLCLWDKSAIVSRRELSKDEFNSIESIDGYDNPEYDDEMKEINTAGLLNENSNDRKVNKYIKEKFGITDFQEIRNKVMEIYEKIPYARIGGGYHMLGVLRLLFEENLPREEYSTLNKILYKIGHCNFYEKVQAGVLDPDFSGQSFEELKEKLFVPDFEGTEFSTSEKQVKAANGYTVTRIDSYDEMNARCDGEWCISYDDTLWYELIDDGTVYLVENEGLIDKYDKEYEKNPEFWQDLGYMAGEEDEMAKDGYINDNLAWTNGLGSWKFPYDVYGLSRIVVVVYKNVFACYSRWNMPNDFDGDYLTKEQLEELLGVKFEDVFKPLGKPGNAAWEYDQFGRKVPFGSVQHETVAEGAEPESDEYMIGGEGGNNEYFHVNESTDSVIIDNRRLTCYDVDAVPFISFIKKDGSRTKIFIGEKGELHSTMPAALISNGEISRGDFNSLWDIKRDEERSGRVWVLDDYTTISFYSYPKDPIKIYKYCVEALLAVRENTDSDFDIGKTMVDWWSYDANKEVIMPVRWFNNGVVEAYMPYINSCRPVKNFMGEYEYELNTTKGKFVLNWEGDETDSPSDSISLNENKEHDNEFKSYFKPIAEFMKKEGLNVTPFPKVKLNWDEQDGLFIKTGYYEPESKTIVIFCADRHPKDILRTFAHEMIHHSQNLNGVDLNFTSNDDVKDNKRLEKIEAEAYLKGNVYFRKWTEYENKQKDVLQEGKKVVKNDEGEIVPDKCDKCGGEVVLQIHGEPVYICKECGKYFGTMPFKCAANESFDVKAALKNLKKRRDPANKENWEINEDTNPEDIDLSSFNIKTELNPKFWKDGHLDSRIRMKLLDIADDFIEALGISWVKPDDIIMTGSLANFNWNKKFSDIDLHVVIDYSKVDKRRDFVDNYFYSQKKIWNDEHKDLKIFGFPVEVYVQDSKEKHASTGVYSLDKDEWIKEPERKKLSTAKINKSLIKNRVADYIDKIDELLTIYKTADDDYKIRKVSEKAEKLFDEIKKERKSSLDGKDSEITNGNLIFKCLRRLGYIEKLIDLKSETYDKLNSLS